MTTSLLRWFSYRGERIAVTFQAEPFEVLVGEFHDIGLGGHALDAGHVRRLVLDEAGADVRVERDESRGGLAVEQGL